MRIRAAALLLAALLSCPAQAGEGAPPSVIAIVDVQRLLQESLAAKSVQQQIEAQSGKFQTEIASEESELRKAEQELAKMHEAAQSEAYAEREQKLRQRFMDVERHVQSRRKALDQAFTDAMGTVRKGIVDIVTAVSREKGVNLAIVKQQVIWNDSAIDITDEVLARLNKELPRLEIKVAPEEGAGREPSLLMRKPSAERGRK